VSGTHGINWLAWWQLLRVANVFTAASNVIAGFLLVQRGWQPLGPMLLLVIASMLLYEAGMVLNDVCDAKLDAVERSERPIPSGRVSKRNALRVGVALLIGGIVSAISVTWLTGQFAPSLIAVTLAAIIVLYNVRAKSTRLGLLTMGLCRFLNVCLGASISPALTTGAADAWLLAWAVFFHTYGLTRIARHEANSIDTVDLWAGSASVLMGAIWLTGLPVASEESAVSPTAWVSICLALLSWEIYLAYNLISAASHMVVRQTVGRLIMLFLVIDAAACTLAVGWAPGLAVLSLIVPMKLLARLTPMT
jgi:hypothetical protein